ncbi:hypothetical protein MalM25_15010 [Planctomycetes bacterium MalM25]|nr:hypothetical protein MalM25_15010 [Planctomycetes bacterium MalM25]
MSILKSFRLALLIAAMCLTEAPAWAVRGEVVLAPLDKNRVHVFSGGSGLRLSLNSSWYPDGGYLPVNVVLEAKGASITDRRLEVSLHLLSTMNQRFNATRDLDDAEAVVRRELILPAGETELVARILCPTVALSDRLGCRVLVNGVEDQALRTLTTLVTPGMRQTGALRVYRPVDASPKSYPRQGNWFAIGSRRNSWVSIDDLQGERFDEWLAYTAVDAVAMSLAELERLAEQSPEKLNAIRRWTLAGGSLWIEQAEPGGTGSMEEESLPEIDRLLALGGWRFVAVGEESQRPPEEEDEDDQAEDDDREIEADAEAAQADPPETSQPPPTPGSPPQPVATPAETTPKQDVVVREPPLVPIEGAPGWGYVAATPKREPGRGGRPSIPTTLPDGTPLERFTELLRRAGSSAPPERIDSRAWFAQRDAGFGRILAFRQSSRSTPTELRSIAGASLSNSWRLREWSRRHGLAVGGKCNEYGNLLIPDVGVAPVNEFQVLITLFVLVVGPLNYWLLWRQRQLHLLVITAPLGALVVTLGLVAYAAVSDGFGVKARARSVTLLDQTAGEAASWSRVTHYAATAPAQPATIPADTAIYPVSPAWEGAFNTAAGTRTLDWTDAGQQLTSGWFPTRTAVQHLMVRCRATEARLDFAGSDESPEVTNRLGTPLELLLVRNEAGDWLAAEELPAEGQTTLEPIAYREAMLKYRTLGIDNEPTFPIGAGRAIEETLDRMGRSAEVRRRQRNLSTVTLDGNLANRTLDRLGGLAGGAALDVPPRSYLGVSTQAVETPLGWDGVVEVGSYHVTVGRW